MAFGSVHTLDATDGFYSKHLHRPIAKRGLRFIPPFMSANTVTTASLIVGMTAAWLTLKGSQLAAMVLIQVYCVLSCMDGEVARKHHAASAKGDFYDTLTDRTVEIAVLIALVDHLDLISVLPSRAWLLPCASVVAVYLITYTSEKYRSSFKVGFPKPKEGAFQFVTSGIDARMTAYTIIIGVDAVSDGKNMAVLLFLGVLAVEYANVVFRWGLIAFSMSSKH